MSLQVFILKLVLKNIGRQLGQLGTFAFLQFNVRGNRLVTETADDVIKTVR
jgi:hypothetical protein